MSDAGAQIDLAAALRQHFGFDEFNAGQEEAIRHSVAGRDVVVIMPTGSGKSLCYQLTSMILEGVTVVISPLIALMKDQVDALSARGLPATFINSSLDPGEMNDRIAGLRAGRYKLVYIAPERFRDRRFLDVFTSMPLALFAIDEAHCISQWGHDFRPDFLRLRHVLDQVPDTRVMALTATATPDVRADIVAQLGLGSGSRQPPEVMVQGFRRPNLRLRVTRTSTHAQKLGRIRDVLREWRTGIVYCSTRKQTEKVAALLKGVDQSSAVYHGGMSDEERKAAQDSFMAGKEPVVVATNAFGMGVDRGDLRFVIHWDIPGSIEAYYQEIGRAGRDGEPAICELLYNYADVRTQEFFLEGANPSRADFEATWTVVRTQCLHEPATCSMAEWTEQVPGVRNEMAVRTVMSRLERAGLIQREKQPGSKVYTTTIAADADLGALEEQFRHLAAKREADEKKLKEMLRYVSTPRCRHAFILNYFGESDVAPHCQACDQCKPVDNDAAREPTEEEAVVLQKILSCVARMDRRFGAARVVQVLTGSKAKPVLDRGLDRLPTYGLLRDRGESYVRALLDELIRVHCVAIDDGEYPVVTITAAGREVMLRKSVVRLVWPTAAPARRGAAAAIGDDAPEAAYDSDLFAQLKAWRLATAREEGVPPYVVMGDKTLKAVAAVRPDSLAALEQVHGMGPTRIAKYGDGVLAVLDAWSGDSEA